jgi:1,4-dihydroxy-2-naphthoyl-CoA hydrolase
MDLLKHLESRRLPFADLMGVRFLSATSDCVRAEMMVTAALCTVPAVLHGGAIMAFADTLGGCATALNIADGVGTVTLESKTNFFAPAPLGTRVIGECVALHRGKRTMAWQTRITNDAGRLLALVMQTQMILDEPRR